MTDPELLRRYRTERSEAAFATLVQRHIDLVYSAAVRQVSSPDLAREVARLVFTELATNTHAVRGHAYLPAWLYAAVCRHSTEVIRREVPRAKAEPAAPVRSMVDPNGDATWVALRPLLDEALADLGEEEREIVLRRFARSQGLRDLSAAKGISEEAAQKRVVGVLERLRGILIKRGLTTGTTALGSTLAAHLVTAAPGDLSATIVEAVGTSSESAGGGSARGMKGLGVATAAAVAALACLLYIRHAQAAELRTLRVEEHRLQTAAKNRAGEKATTLPSAAPASPATASPDLEARARVLAHRIRRLKDWMDLVPEDRLAKAPLLTDVDWIVAVDGFSELDQYDATEHVRTTQVAAVENALNRLDQAAARRFEPDLWQAFRRYRKATGKALPDEVKDLLPYFATPVDPAFLRGYSVEPPQGITYRRGDNAWSAQLPSE